MLYEVITDMRVIDYLVAEFKKDQGVDLRKDPRNNFV